MKAYGESSSYFGFTGEQDWIAGLVFLRARYYDPGIGRFISKDPFPGILEEPSSLNPYNYAYNNPILYLDPNGQFAFIPLMLVAAAGGLLGGLSYYALQSILYENECWQWDWTEALFWSGIGTGLGLLIGITVYGGWWIGAKIGWWGTAVTGSNIVYQGWINGQRYIGITKEWVARQSYWLRQGMTIEPIDKLRNLTRLEARAVEQYLIEYYGLENLANKINSIATSNPGGAPHFSYIFTPSEL
jgi:RHS repeat-associated protein